MFQNVRVEDSMGRRPYGSISVRSLNQRKPSVRSPGYWSGRDVIYLNEKNHVIRAGIYSIDRIGIMNEILCFCLSSLYPFYNNLEAD
jgi:hypothetical protein